MMIDALFGDGAMYGLLSLGIIALAFMVAGLRRRTAETNKRTDRWSRHRSQPSRLTRRRCLRRPSSSTTAVVRSSKRHGRPRG